LLVLIVLVLIQQQTSGQSGSSRFAELDGLRIHYVTHGEGKEARVFVLVGVGSLNNWKLQMEAFKGKKRLILLDLPGHGLQHTITPLPVAGETRCSRPCGVFYPHRSFYES
jgi:pimeloyl-ACP methyl ester carboxylesterase